MSNEKLERFKQEIPTALGLLISMNLKQNDKVTRLEVRLREERSKLKLLKKAMKEVGYYAEEKVELAPLDHDKRKEVNK